MLSTRDKVGLKNDLEEGRFDCQSEVFGTFRLVLTILLLPRCPEAYAQFTRLQIDCIFGEPDWQVLLEVLSWVVNLVFAFLKEGFEIGWEHFDFGLPGHFKQLAAVAHGVTFDSRSNLL